MENLWLMVNSYPLVMSKYLLNMAIAIVDFPINSMVMFHSYGRVYQRVSTSNLSYVLYV